MQEYPSRYGGKIIFEGNDSHGVVEVVDAGNIRMLHFGTAVSQSSMYLDDPFRLEMEYNRVMMLGLLFNPNPKRVLFLGLGGGAKPKFIWKYYTETKIDVIELSPLVIETCYRYFEVPKDERLQIYNQDALLFLSEPPPVKYDMIFVDLYVKSGISPVVADPRFFEYCKRILNPKGILLWNMWTSSARDVIETTLGYLGATFGTNMLVLPNQESTNYVLLIFNEEEPQYRLTDLYDVARTLKEHSSLDFPQLITNLKNFEGLGSGVKN